MGAPPAVDVGVEFKGGTVYFAGAEFTGGMVDFRAARGQWPDGLPDNMTDHLP